MELQGYSGVNTIRTKIVNCMSCLPLLWWELFSRTWSSESNVFGSPQSLSLLNPETSALRKAVLQNGMTLDVIIALRGGLCAIIQIQHCVFILDESPSVSSLLNHMRTQGSGLRDPIPRPGDLINQWFGSWGTWWKHCYLL